MNDKLENAVAAFCEIKSERRINHNLTMTND